MAAFTIITIEPPAYPHCRAFDEIRILLYHSLLDLGHQVSLRNNRWQDGGILIVLGAHLLSEEDAKSLPEETIILNTEQLNGEYGQWRDRIQALAARHRVWDYSTANLDWLRRVLGEQARVHRLRLGYHPKLEKLERRPSRRREFVFFGSVTPYRQTIFDSIRLSDRLKVRAYFGIYGWLRDQILAACLAALNIHSQAGRILEWPRCIHLIANRVPCIALLHPDTYWEDAQPSYCLPCSESNATSELEAYFAQPEMLANHAEEAWQRFRLERQNAYTEAALDQSFAGGYPEVAAAAAYPWRPLPDPMDLDRQWYGRIYWWTYSDPRNLEDYHAEEGRYRQYHPSPLFYTAFRAPIWLDQADPGSPQLHDRPSQDPALRYAVVLHFYRQDSARQFFTSFGVNLAAGHFYITVSDPDVAIFTEAIARECGVQEMEIKIIHNLGRDIPSKYMVFNEDLQAYDLCLFSHGKQSDANWFFDHNSILAGSAQRVHDICALFATDPGLGLLFPDYLESLHPWLCWGQMRPVIDELLSEFGCDSSSIELLEFPAGGFFWARPQALLVMHSLRLRGQPLDWQHLPPEPLPRDGTLLHALERMPCLSCEMMGLRWEKLGRYGSRQQPTAGL